jgi:hypothetical protein
VTLVGYGQLLATLGTARSQHAATVLGGHTLAETMLVHATAIVGLKCSFHCNESLLLVLLSQIRAAKLVIIIELRKKTAEFSIVFMFFLLQYHPISMNIGPFN